MKYISSFFLLANLILGGSCDFEGFDSENPGWGEDCSQVIGDHPCNFTLKDQDDKDVSLYDYHGKIIILDISAMWCGPCRSAAVEVEDLQTRYGDDVVYLTLLVEDASRKNPNVRDSKAWADAFGIKSAPVLAGSRELTNSSPQLGWPISVFPSFFIIDKEMIYVKEETGFRRGKIESIILDMLAEEQDAEGA
jgi:thiol-disulfide isomerase/thioredoxin